MKANPTSSASRLGKHINLLSDLVSRRGKDLITTILIIITILAILTPLPSEIALGIVFFLFLFWAFTPLGRHWVKFTITFAIGFFLTAILAWFASGGSETVEFGKPLGKFLIDEYNNVDDKWFVLAKFGWFGGLIYSILADGKLELPSVNVDDKSVDPGFIGDVLVGVAGAFIAYTLIVSTTGQGGSEAGIDDLSTLIVLGIVGGYGGKAIIKSSLKKFVGQIDEQSTVEDKEPSEEVAPSKQLPTQGLSQSSSSGAGNSSMSTAREESST